MEAPPLPPSHASTAHTPPFPFFSSFSMLGRPSVGEKIAGPPSRSRRPLQRGRNSPILAVFCALSSSKTMGGTPCRILLWATLGSMPPPAAEREAGGGMPYNTAKRKGERGVSRIRPPPGGHAKGWILGSSSFLGAQQQRPFPLPVLSRLDIQTTTAQQLPSVLKQRGRRQRRQKNPAFIICRRPFFLPFPLLRKKEGGRKGFLPISQTVIRPTTHPSSFYIASSKKENTGLKESLVLQLEKCGLWKNDISAAR